LMAEFGCRRSANGAPGRFRPNPVCGTKIKRRFSSRLAPASKGANQNVGKSIAIHIAGARHRVAKTTIRTPPFHCLDGLRQWAGAEGPWSRGARRRHRRWWVDLGWRWFSTRNYPGIVVLRFATSQRQARSGE
jgi:hypothetical protein